MVGISRTWDHPNRLGYYVDIISSLVLEEHIWHSDAQHVAISNSDYPPCDQGDNPFEG